MPPRKATVAPQIRALLGFGEDEPDADILRAWKERASLVCKPCWELKYCPYGPLVEDFPLLPPTRSAALEHNAYLRQCLDTGLFGDGQTLDDDRRANFQEMVDQFRADDYPESIPKAIAESQRAIFGHICPVFFSAEPFTETTEGREVGRRAIPFQTKMRVARRDNHTCQECGKHLLDSELEFDHVIPVSKGGPSQEHNLRLTCFDCNRRKSNRVTV